MIEIDWICYDFISSHSISASKIYIGTKIIEGKQVHKGWTCSFRNLPLISFYLLSFSFSQTRPLTFFYVLFFCSIFSFSLSFLSHTHYKLLRHISRIVQAFPLTFFFVNFFSSSLLKILVNCTYHSKNQPSLFSQIFF